MVSQLDLTSQKQQNKKRKMASKVYIDAFEDEWVLESDIQSATTVTSDDKDEEMYYIIDRDTRKPVGFKIPKDDEKKLFLFDDKFRYIFCAASIDYAYYSPLCKYKVITSRTSPYLSHSVQYSRKTGRPGGREVCSREEIERIDSLFTVIDVNAMESKLDKVKDIRESTIAEEYQIVLGKLKKDYIDFIMTGSELENRFETCVKVKFLLEKSQKISRHEPRSFYSMVDRIAPHTGLIMQNCNEDFSFKKAVDIAFFVSKQGSVLLNSHTKIATALKMITN